MILRSAISFLLLCSGGAQALDLALPSGSTLRYETSADIDAYVLPKAPYAEGLLPVIALEGRVVQQVWRVKGTPRTGQMIEPLRRQLQAAGFDILLDCQALTCGGFDFRFAIDVVPAPDMFVDLLDYRFVSATKASEHGLRGVAVLVSKSGDDGLIQIVRVDPEALPSLPVQEHLRADSASVPETGQNQITDQLTRSGRVVLSDLRFETGSATLQEAAFQSLADLATLLAENRSLRIALVGHTDNVGSLANNIALSKRRAEAVRARLLALGTLWAQVEAEGVGYLSPLQSNATAQGRGLNRRVEAVLLEATP